MDEAAVRRALPRHWRYAGRDEDIVHEIYHDDAVLEFPQSGERFIGKSSFLTWRKQFPAKLEVVQAVWRSPIVLVLLGVTLITMLGSVRINRRRHLPEVTPLAVILWVGFALFLIAMGVGSVAAAFSDRTNTPGFYRGTTGPASQ
jgi:hypothetical protein